MAVLPDNVSGLGGLFKLEFLGCGDERFVGVVLEGERPDVLLYKGDEG